MAFIQADFMSKSLKRTVRFTAVLPTDSLYPDEFLPPLPLRTLYLLHGYSSNPIIWTTEAPVLDMATAHGIAIVMLDCGNNNYIDDLKRQDLYSYFVGRELPAYTRKIFPLSHKREDTIIAGFSMGGYGSLYNGIKYHDVFGHIISISPAVLSPEFFEIQEALSFIGATPEWYEAMFGDMSGLADSEMNILTAVRKLKEKGAQFPSIYHACGTNDQMIFGNRRLDALLTSLGIPHTYEEEPGAHDGLFFAPHIKKGVERLPFERPPQPPKVFWREADA
jgi:S-formylglutathione hydrolase FrmB